MSAGVKLKRNTTFSILLFVIFSQFAQALYDLVSFE
jgi:hypothetical protein